MLAAGRMRSLQSCGLRWLRKTMRRRSCEMGQKEDFIFCASAMWWDVQAPLSAPATFIHAPSAPCAIPQPGCKRHRRPAAQHSLDACVALCVACRPCLQPPVALVVQVTPVANARSSVACDSHKMKRFRFTGPWCTPSCTRSGACLAAMQLGAIDNRLRDGALGGGAPSHTWLSHLRGSHT
jgi:hypothetical protein